jgi:hypothetical protein
MASFLWAAYTNSNAIATNYSQDKDSIDLLDLLVVELEGCANKKTLFIQVFLNNGLNIYYRQLEHAI